MTEELEYALSGLNLFDLSTLESLPTYWRRSETLKDRVLITGQKKQPMRRTRDRQTIISSTLFVLYDYSTHRYCIPTGRIFAHWSWVTKIVREKGLVLLHDWGYCRSVYQLCDSYSAVNFVYDYTSDHCVSFGSLSPLVEFYDLTSVPWLLSQRPLDDMAPREPEHLAEAFQRYGDRAHAYLRLGSPRYPYGPRVLEFGDSEPEDSSMLPRLADEFTNFEETPLCPYAPSPASPSPAAAMTAADYDVRGEWTEVDPASLVYDIRQLALS